MEKKRAPLVKPWRCVSRALRDETGSDLVYVYVFGGGIPHLHLHLTPHHPGDALNTQHDPR